MQNVLIARRYARALIQSVGENSILKIIEEQIGIFLLIMNTENSVLNELMKNPVFSVKERKKIILFICKKYCFKKNLQDFFIFLIIRDRFSFLTLILEAFSTELDIKLKRARSIIVSARKIQDKDAILLLKKLTEKTNKKVLPEFIIDTKVIGGIKVFIDGLSIDQTILTNLERLQQKLKLSV